MNNKSRFIGLSTLAFAAIAAIGCNQQKETYNVSFEGVGCKANCEAAGKTGVTSFAFDGKTGSEVSINITPDADKFISESAEVKINGVEAKANVDYTFEGATGGSAVKITFSIKGDTTVKVTATKVSGLTVKGSEVVGYKVTTDKPEYEAGDTATVTMTATPGYLLPTEAQIEDISLAVKGASTGAKYTPSTPTVDDDELTFTVTLPRESLIVSANGIAETYKVCDDSYGATIEIEQQNGLTGDEVKYNEDVTAKINLATGYELPLTEDGIKVYADGVPHNILSLDKATSTFKFHVPYVEKEEEIEGETAKVIHIVVTAKSYPVDIITNDCEGCSINLPTGPFARNQTINAIVNLDPGYQSDNKTTFGAYYFIGGQKKTDGIVISYDAINRVLTVTIPDPTDIVKFDLYVWVKATPIDYTIDAFSDEHDFITAEVTQPADVDDKYHVGDDIVIKLTPADGYTLPYTKNAYVFIGVDANDVEYVQDEEDESIYYLKFEMPADDVTITGEAIPVEYSFDTDVYFVPNGGKPQETQGVVQIDGMPYAGEHIKMEIKPVLGYALKGELGTYEGATLKSKLADLGLQFYYGDDQDNFPADASYYLQYSDYAVLAFTMPAGKVHFKAEVEASLYNINLNITGAVDTHVIVTPPTGEGTPEEKTQATVRDKVEMSFKADDAHGYVMTTADDLATRLVTTGFTLRSSNIQIVDGTATITIPYMYANSISVSGELSRPTFTVTANITGGIIAGLPTGGVAHKGDAISLVLLPSSGNKLPAKADIQFTGITADEVTYSNITGELSFVMPKAPVTITATCEPIPTYTVTALASTATTHGKVTINGTEFYEGDVVSGTIVPDKGYNLPTSTNAFKFYEHGSTTATVDVTLHYTPGESTFWFEMPAKDIDVAVTCPAMEYTITTHCEGETAPASVSGTEGQTVSVSFTPLPGHRAAEDLNEFYSTHIINGITSDQISYALNATSGVGTLTFTAIHSGGTIIGSAPFESYRVTLGTITGGTIAGVPGDVHFGDTVNLTLIPTSGYTLPETSDAITVTGTTTTDPVEISSYSKTTGVFSFKMPAEGVTITATCQSIVTYSIITNVHNGYVEGVPSSAIPAGTPVSLKIVAFPGCTLPDADNKVSVIYGPDDTDVEDKAYDLDTGVVTFTMPEGDATVNATCIAPVTYSIDVTNVTNGTLIGTLTNLHEGDAVNLTLAPDNGHILPSSVTVDGASHSYNPDTGVLSIVVGTDDISVSATCPEDTGYYHVTTGSVGERPSTTTVSLVTDPSTGQDREFYRGGETVYVHVSWGDEAYHCIHVYVNGEEVAMTESQATWAKANFVMPYRDVTVVAVIELVPAP